MSGTVFGVGVGPGDPELLTLKAFAVIRRVPVLAYLAPEEGPSLARRIVAPHLDTPKEEIAMRTAMVPGDAPAQAVYDEGAARILQHCAAGRDVAVLCEGDPLFYGSFMYLLARLEGRVPVTVVAGVTSLTACAAAAQVALSSRNEVLAVVPAPLPEAELEARLRGVDTAAVFKVGRHLAKVRRVLERLGRLKDAVYVARIGMADQQVMPLAQAGEGRGPYFSMVLIGKAREWQADE